MKKKINRIMGMICYALGILCALYVGGWVMLIKPINMLIMSFKMGNITLTLLLKSIVRIAFSTTVGGFVWCLGYVGYNFFKGTEDPNWALIEEKLRLKNSSSDFKEKQV